MNERNQRSLNRSNRNGRNKHVQYAFERVT